MLKKSLVLAAAALSLTVGALTVSSSAQAGYGWSGYGGGFRSIYRPAFVPVYRPVVHVYQAPVYRPVYQAPTSRPTYGGWHCR